jgi:hypothetical protein
MNRMFRFVVGLILLMNSFSLYSSDIIRIVSRDIRVKGLSQEKFFLSFHQGDVVSFDFEELHNKKIALLDVSEFKGRTVYQMKKLSLLKNGSFLVPQTAVYSFLFKNRCIFARNIHVNIYRKPSKEKYKFFDTNPRWVEQVDTVYNIRKSDEIVRYDTAWFEASKIVKDTCKRVEDLSLEKNIRLEAAIPFLKKNRAVIEIKMGEEDKSPLLEKKPLEWVYWIGVGQEAEESWHNTVKTIGKLGGSLVSTFVNPLLGFAVGLIPTFIVPSKGKNVSYYFVTDSLNAQLFLKQKEVKSIEQGKGVVSYGKNKNVAPEKLYLCLLNENLITPIDVSVKYTTIFETCTYRVAFEKQFRVTPVYKRNGANIPKLIKTKVPVVNSKE